MFRRKWQGSTFQDLLLTWSLTDRTASFVPPPPAFFLLKIQFKIYNLDLLTKCRDHDSWCEKESYLDHQTKKNRLLNRQLYWKNTVSQKTQHFLAAFNALNSAIKTLPCNTSKNVMKDSKKHFLGIARQEERNLKLIFL